MYLENSSFQRGLQIKNPNARNILLFIRGCRDFLGCKVEIKASMSEDKNFNDDHTFHTKNETRVNNCEWRLMGVYFKIEGYEFFYEIAVENIISIIPGRRNEYELIESFGDKLFRKTLIKKIS